MSYDISRDMWDKLCARVAELESRTAGLVRLGPREPSALELGAAARRITKALEKVPLPADRNARVLVSGDAVPEDQSHTQLKANGQQKDYVVLSAEERGKGFVRPYRDAYKHLKCGKITTMARSIAETYARDPGFYSGTMCVTCGGHFPVGENGEFVWYEMDGTVGPKVGV